MTLAYWRREAIEVEVVNLLRDYGVSKYPIDIAALIKQIGIPMISYENASPDERVLFNLASTDAFSVNTFSFTNPKIFFNPDVKPVTREPFNLGHELGHIWLEHSEEDPLREAEADYFSGYILAPHPLIARFGLLESGLAKAFGIGPWSAAIACAQTFERIRKGSSRPLPHEQWLLDNITFERRIYEHPINKSAAMKAADPDAACASVTRTVCRIGNHFGSDNRKFLAERMISNG